MSKALRGVKPCGSRLARDIDDALAAGGEIIAASAAAEAPGPPAQAEKIRQALEDALADGAMAAALLDDWDSTVDQYGYRMPAGGHRRARPGAARWAARRAAGITGWP